MPIILVSFLCLPRLLVKGRFFFVCYIIYDDDLFRHSFTAALITNVARFVLDIAVFLMTHIETSSYLVASHYVSLFSSWRLEGKWTLTTAWNFSDLSCQITEAMHRPESRNSRKGRVRVHMQLMIIIQDYSILQVMLEKDFYLAFSPINIEDFLSFCPIVLSWERL